MLVPGTNDAETLALNALAATLSDERRARRFLDLSGIDTVELRRRAAQPALLAALIRFLEAHEPDLIAVAAQVGASPADLVSARRMLEK
jgi:gamma-glutamylcysteine synthetase